MDSFSEIMKSFGMAPLATMLTLCLIALAYLYRAREKERSATEAAREKERTAAAAIIQALNDRNFQTAEKVFPVAEKLADGVTTLERLMAKDH